MTSRSSLGLIYMVQGLQSLGHDPEPVLRRHGLSLAHLDPSTRIDRAQEMRIYADLADTLDNPLLGLKLGGYYGLAGYGPLVMLLMTCATAYEAIQTGVKYQELTYLYSHIRLAPGEQMSALVLNPSNMPAKAFRFRVDGEVSGTYKMVQDMQATMGMKFQPDRLDMPYPRPAEAAAYEAYFGCPVRFGEREARFWIPNKLLQVRLPSADASAHAMYRTLCDQQLQQQRSLSSGVRLSERVLNHLGLFNNHFPSSDEVARSMGMSERSLRRQLSDEGRNFRDLLAEARYSRARQLLKETPLSIEQVGLQLGYAEAAAFIHAFRRWSGQSPRQYREG